MKNLIVASILLAACESPEKDARIAEKDARIAELESKVELLTSEKSSQDSRVKALNLELESWKKLSYENELRLKKDYEKRVKVLTEPIEKRHDSCDITCKQKYAKCLVNGFYPNCDVSLEGCEKRCDTIRDLENHNLPFRCVYP